MAVHGISSRFPGQRWLLARGIPILEDGQHKEQGRKAVQVAHHQPVAQQPLVVQAYGTSFTVYDQGCYEDLAATPGITFSEFRAIRDECLIRGVLGGRDAASYQPTTKA